MKERKVFLEILLILAINFAIGFYLLDEIPGIHFDEARYANTAKNIIKSVENPLIQQQDYSGNFAYYFIVLEFLVMNRYDIFSLNF